ncbi:tetratricopeptide repeat protein [Bosea sp. AK1]|uniref:tetratricopeptide repeat protein n=1 Tax=Bosea sp. AK1 TaxID=2587160 RepID=UPI001154A6D0|nr:tetratricopeptide repeat protein [Bosea sp. AK1]TQI74785.1 tetratricopeptide repeat protein [Bosea sp. AK1]
MSVKPILIAVAVSGLAFYTLGRYGHDIASREAVQPVIQPALAQQQPPQAPAEAVPAPNDVAQAKAPDRPAAAQPAAPKVDETALRYFAGQGDTRRYEAELARLKALYPDWKPPTDLSSQGKGQAGDPELERMWRLFAEGKYGEVRAAIAQRGSTDPNWRAPADLTAQLDTAEARQRLVNASNARQWEQVIRLGTETPAMLTCASVDALWRVAEAFVQTGKPERARDAYAYVLTNCTKPAERTGTMQKALATLPENLVEALLSQEQQNEFASIRDEMARRHIGKAADDPTQKATPAEIQRIEALANAASTPDDAILLGFYTLHHDEPAKAATWFQTALARNGGAKAAEGAVLALGDTKKYQEAETLGAQWLEAGAANRKAYLDAITALLTQEPPPRLDRAVIERIVKTVGQDKYAAGAGALGWYAYNAGQISPAGTWFETALSWDRGNEPAAYGLALVRERLRDQAGLRTLVAEWGSRSQRIADILNPRRPRSAPTAEHERQTRQMPAAESAHRRPTPIVRSGPDEPIAHDAAPEPARRSDASRATGGNCGGGSSGAAALQRGWCLLNLKRPVAAAQAFEAARRGGNAQIASDAAAGVAYAKMQQGLTAEATVAASAANLPPARRKELSTLLLAEQFYAQYDAKDYNGALITLSQRRRLAPETTDLMLMRGWSYYNLGRYDDAAHIFEALYKANKSPEALSGLTAIRDVTKRNAQ